MKYIACIVQDNNEIIHGNACVTSIEELYKCILEKDAEELVITRAFAEEYFTPSGLAHFVENAQTLNSRIIINVDGIMSMFDERAVRELKRYSMEELIYVLEKNPKEILDTIRMICDSYLSTSYETLVANNKVSTLHLRISSLQKELKELHEDFDRVMRVKNEYEAKFNTLVSRINYKYEKDIKGNAMFQVTGSRYDKILYFKEITRVHFADTLIYYLQEMLKTFYGVPARLVVIEPPYAYGRASLYPYCKPSYHLTYNDVYKEDIFMPGLQPNLMEDILRNSAALNYLIVLDRSGYAVPHIYGDKVELVFFVSDLKDIELQGLPMDRIISYSDETMNIPFIPDFNSLSTEIKLQKYSSMPVIKTLIDLIERR